MARPKNWKAICAVAAELLVARELDGEEVEHLIDVADGNATRSEFETLRQMQQALRDPSRRSTKDP